MDDTKPTARNLDGDDLVIRHQANDSGTGSSHEDVFQATLAGDATPRMKRQLRNVRPRRRLLPLNLFILTCFSTFLTGATLWNPSQFVISEGRWGTNLMPLRTAILLHWQDGLIYAGCLLAILLTHEMGHFFATLRYRIPASYPYFIPLPIISPIGTMGAVIGMDGMRANRREMFDIGIAGPLAGLVVAIPVTWMGVMQLDLSTEQAGPFLFDSPLAVRMIMDQLRPSGYEPGIMTAHSQLNPYFMAGWVGLLVTGLNMMPVGQLDGGHITYALFGKRAHWIARIFMVIAVVAMVSGAASQGLALMVALVLFMIGTDHPPTSDDTVKLGFIRIVLGVLSLSIPILCFAPKLIVPVGYSVEIQVPAEQPEQDKTAANQAPPSGSLVVRRMAPSQKDPDGNENWFEQHQAGSFMARDTLQALSEQPIRQSHLQHAERAQER